MVAETCPIRNKLPKQSQSKPANVKEKKHQKLIFNSKERKQTAGMQTAKEDKKNENNELNTSPTENFSKALHPSSNPDSKSRSKNSKKRFVKAHRSTKTRKMSSNLRLQDVEKANMECGTTLMTIKGERRSNAHRQRRSSPRRIPLVPPTYRKRPRHPSRGQIKYVLKPAESPKKYHQRVRSNRRMNRRQARTKKRKETQNKSSIPSKEYSHFLGSFWTEMETKLDDLASLDCGSYSDDLKKVENVVKEVVDTSHTRIKNKKGRKKTKMKALDSLNALDDFVFNPTATEFVPRKADKKVKSNSVTLQELLESAKGQKLPKMPRLIQSPT